MQITVEMVKNLSLFANLNEEDIAKSLPIFKLLEPQQSNFRIFEEGDAGDSLYLILEGEVEIQKLIDVETKTYKLLSVLPAGSYFGEMALLTGEPRSAAAVLRNADGKLLKVEHDSFINLMSSSPRIASKIVAALINVLSDRLRASSEEVVTLYETGRIIGNNTHYNDIVTQVLDRLIKVTKSTAGFVMMWNDVVECFECNVALPVFPPVTTLHKDSSLANYWLKLETSLTKETASDFVLTDELGFNVPSTMYTPLFEQIKDFTHNNIVNKVSGIIVLISNKENAYNLRQINLVRSVADQVGQAIANSRLLMENEARHEHNLVYVTADL